MNYLLALVFALFIVDHSVAQISDYDSVYLLNNCVTLDAKESIQKERADLIYKWTFGEGAIKHGEVVEHCYNSLGTYDITLSVVDPQVSALFQEEWLFEMTITEHYLLSFGVKRQGGNIITAISSLTYQNAPEGVDFFWDFGDGIYAVGDEIIHEYKHNGKYQIRLLAKVEAQEEIINLVQTRTISIEGHEGI